MIFYQEFGEESFLQCKGETWTFRPDVVVYVIETDVYTTGPARSVVACRTSVRQATTTKRRRQEPEDEQTEEQTNLGLLHGPYASHFKFEGLKNVTHVNEDFMFSMAQNAFFLCTFHPESEIGSLLFGEKFFRSCSAVLIVKAVALKKAAKIANTKEVRFSFFSILIFFNLCFL